MMAESKRNFSFIRDSKETFGDLSEEIHTPARVKLLGSWTDNIYVIGKLKSGNWLVSIDPDSPNRIVESGDVELYEGTKVVKANFSSNLKEGDIVVDKDDGKKFYIKLFGADQWYLIEVDGDEKRGPFKSLDLIFNAYKCIQNMADDKSLGDLVCDIQDHVDQNPSLEDDWNPLLDRIIGTGTVADIAETVNSLPVEKKIVFKKMLDEFQRQFNLNFSYANGAQWFWLIRHPLNPDVRIYAYGDEADIVKRFGTEAEIQELSPSEWETAMTHKGEKGVLFLEKDETNFSNSSAAESWWNSHTGTQRYDLLIKLKQDPGFANLVKMWTWKEFEKETTDSLREFLEKTLSDPKNNFSSDISSEVTAAIESAAKSIGTEVRDIKKDGDRIVIYLKRSNGDSVAELRAKLQTKNGIPELQEKLDIVYLGPINFSVDDRVSTIDSALESAGFKNKSSSYEYLRVETPDGDVHVPLLSGQRIKNMNPELKKETMSVDELISWLKTKKDFLFSSDLSSLKSGSILSLDWDGPSKAKVESIEADGRINLVRIDKSGTMSPNPEDAIQVTVDELKEMGPEIVNMSRSDAPVCKFTTPGVYVCDSMLATNTDANPNGIVAGPFTNHDEARKGEREYCAQYDADSYYTSLRVIGSEKDWFTGPYFKPKNFSFPGVVQVGTFKIQNGSKIKIYTDCLNFDVYSVVGVLSSDLVLIGKTNDAGELVTGTELELSVEDLLENSAELVSFGIGDRNIDPDKYYTVDKKSRSIFRELPYTTKQELAGHKVADYLEIVSGSDLIKEGITCFAAGDIMIGGKMIRPGSIIEVTTDDPKFMAKYKVITTFIDMVTIAKVGPDGFVDNTQKSNPCVDLLIPELEEIMIDVISFSAPDRSNVQEYAETLAREIYGDKYDQKLVNAAVEKAMTLSDGDISKALGIVKEVYTSK